VVLKGADWKLW